MAVSYLQTVSNVHHQCSGNGWYEHPGSTLGPDLETRHIVLQQDGDDAGVGVGSGPHSQLWLRATRVQV